MTMRRARRAALEVLSVFASLGGCSAATGAADLLACADASCGPNQLCVFPTCCRQCTGPTDAGVCPAGTSPNSLFSGANCRGACIVPCTPPLPYCFDVPAAAISDPCGYCSCIDEGALCNPDFPPDEFGHCSDGRASHR